MSKAAVEGVRVSQLAKELSLPAKDLVEYLQAENFVDLERNPVQGPTSIVKKGTAATIKEHYEAGVIQKRLEELRKAKEAEKAKKTARRSTRRKKTEIAPAAEGQETAVAAATATAGADEAKEQEQPSAPKRRTTRSRKTTKKTEGAATAQPVDAAAAPADSQAPPAGEPSSETEPAEVTSTAAPGTGTATVAISEAGAAAATAVETPAAPPAAAAVTVTPSIPPETPTVTPAVPEEQPSPPPPPVGEHGAAAPPAPEKEVAAPSPPSQAAPAPQATAVAPPPAPPPRPKPPVTPAPRLVAPKRVEMAGPKVVRVEAPEMVPAPRRRGSMPPPPPPTTTKARPQGGRGVRTTTIDDETEDGPPKAGKGRTLSPRRRGGLEGRRGEADKKIRDWTQADLDELHQRMQHAREYRAGFDGDLKRKAERKQALGPRPAVQKGRKVEIEEPITVRSLSVATGIKTGDILRKLMSLNAGIVNINSTLDRDTAQLVAMEFGMELALKEAPSLEEKLTKDLESRRSDPSKLVPRPPVVAILGHVDHGKTSLLDKIRKSNVAEGEAGGITQHIGAWQVQMGEKRVTFIDTPGHQAFTSLRARGAQMTDIVVLVVSAAEGVQPQTIESINHARAAKVPIVVAMNKIDRPDANPQAVLAQLAGNGVNPTSWGGDTEVVQTSALTGQGIPELIEVLDYQAALLDLKADPTAPARGTVVEARVDQGMGPVATVLVQDGTLRVGDVVLAGHAWGRVRTMLNDRGQYVSEAGPSTPVVVSGLSCLPNAGDRFYVVDDAEMARTVAEERQERARRAQLAAASAVRADPGALLAVMNQKTVKTINLIIKADVLGSVETLSRVVTGHNTEEVKVKVIHAAVGAISESDVELAIATRDENSNTVIVGFNVVPEEKARELAEQHHVEIRIYRVIYELLDDLKKALSGMLEPEVREKLHGHAEIRQIFRVSRVGNVAGCMVTDGHIQRGSRLRLIRDGKIVAEDLAIESLRRVKDDVREVKAGFECGLKIAGYDDIKVGDRLEAYSRELIHRTL